MATVQSYTSARMKQIEDESVVDGEIQGDNLILTTRAGTPIDAGNVRGATGLTGPQGDVEEAPIDGARYLRGDGTWDKFEGWTMVLDNNQDPATEWPEGFTVESGLEYPSWRIEFGGLGPMTSCDILIYEYGTGINNNAKFIFPENLRPFYEVNVPSLVHDSRQGYKATGSGQLVLADNGAITAPRGEPVVMARYRANNVKVSEVLQYDSGQLVVIRSQFTYIRQSWDTPDKAVTNS